MADRTLLQHFFTAYASQVVDFLRRRMPRTADAQDISQDVFLRMLRVQDLSSIRDPQGYLFTVANNLRRERLYTEGIAGARAQIPLDRALESEPELEVTLMADFEIDLERQLRDLDKAVQGLSERDRTLLTLRFRDGLTYREIARRLGWASKTAVEKALATAIARCRELMEAAEAV